MQPWWKRRGEELTARDWIIITAVGGIIAALILGGVKLAGGSSSNSSSSTASGSAQKSSSSTTSTQAPTRPTGPVYLSQLTPSGGDVPMRGDTQIGDRDFLHSIFYDNIPGNQSNASACQNAGDPTCQATDYSIANAQYHEFSAMLGVAGCGGDTAHWSLTVDSVVIKSGTVVVNSSAQGVSVVIPRGNDLELLVGTSTSFSGAACGGVNIIWGNAQLS
jgi:hypothetical protein